MEAKLQQSFEISQQTLENSREQTRILKSLKRTEEKKYELMKENAKKKDIYRKQKLQLIQKKLELKKEMLERQFEL